MTPIAIRTAATVSALGCVLLGQPVRVQAAPAEDDATEEATPEEASEEAATDPETEAPEGDDAGEEGGGEDTSEGEVEDTSETDAAPAPTPAPEPGKKQKKKRPKRDIDKKALGITVAGYGLLAVGAGLLGGMAAGLGQGKAASDDAKVADVPSAEADRIDAIDRGRKADTLALGMGVAAGVALVTGAILVGVGHPRLTKSLKTARNRCLPSAGPTGAGVGCTFSF